MPSQTEPHRGARIAVRRWRIPLRLRSIARTCGLALALIGLPIGLLALVNMTLAHDPPKEVEPIEAQTAALNLTDPHDRLAQLALEKDLLQFRVDNDTKIWAAKTQVFSITAVAAIGGLYLTWKTFQETKLKNEFEIRKQIDDRIDHATEQLDAEDTTGRPKLSARLNAIHTMEEVAVEAPESVEPSRRSYLLTFDAMRLWRRLRPQLSH